MQVLSKPVPQENQKIQISKSKLIKVDGGVTLLEQ